MIDNRRLKDCAYTILDNAQAIKAEADFGHPHATYLLEKIAPIENDLRVIKRMCEEE